MNHLCNRSEEREQKRTKEIVYASISDRRKWENDCQTHSLLDKIKTF